jgi:hypothetical protein
MGFLSLLGMAGSLVFGLVGMSKEEEQMKDIWGRQERQRAEELAIGQGRFREKMAFEKEQFKEAKRQKRKEWKWMEEGRNFERGTGVANQFLGMLAAEPQLQQQLQQTWRTR